MNLYQVQSTMFLIAQAFLMAYVAGLSLDGAAFAAVILANAVLVVLYAQALKRA